MAAANPARPTRSPAELERALSDPDPLHAIAQLTARWAAAFVLDPDRLTKSSALGADRMARRLGDALPDGESCLRHAVWELMRPLLSPRLAARHADAFAGDDTTATTVDLSAHRGESTLAELELELGEDEPVVGRE